MKPLSTTSKSLLYRHLVDGPLRPVAHGAYLGLLNLELSAHRLRDRVPTSRPVTDLREVTAMIKTFERPGRLRQLVSSIKRHYPELKVIVIDDGRDPQPLPGVATHVMPYDSGLGAGRSMGLSLVETEYVLTLDDDFVLYHRTRLHEAVELMRRTEDIDIMGGLVVDLPLYVTHDYRRASLFDTNAVPVHAPGSRVGGLEVFEKVADFFLARTDRLRRVDWDPGLKRLVHADFFTRARGVLTTVFNPAFRTLHVRNPYDLAYRRVRYDTADDLARLAARYGTPGAVGR